MHIAKSIGSSRKSNRWNEYLSWIELNLLLLTEVRTIEAGERLNGVILSLSMHISGRI